MSSKLTPEPGPKMLKPWVETWTRLVGSTKTSSVPLSPLPLPSAGYSGSASNQSDQVPSARWERTKLATSALPCQVRAN